MEHKIVLTGITGAGKTTAINAVSEIEVVNTGVPNSDGDIDKTLTTVGLDYGEIYLQNGDRLRLYGTPGQARFEFMWRIVSQGALGLIILADNSQDEPLAALNIYLNGFDDLIKRTACVVGVGHLDPSKETELDHYADHLAQHGVLCPVVPVDVRKRSDVLMLLDLLITQLEMKRENDYADL